MWFVEILYRFGLKQNFKRYIKKKGFIKEEIYDDRKIMVIWHE